MCFDILNSESNVSVETQLYVPPLFPGQYTRRVFFFLHVWLNSKGTILDGLFISSF